MSAAVEIHKAVKSPDYVIVTFAPGDTGYVEVGEHVHVSARQMRSDGLALIVENLTAFANRRSIAKVVRPLKENYAFYHAHKLVRVWMDEPTELMLLPERRMGGGWQYSTDTAHERRVKLPTTPEDFFSELEEAFKWCT